VHVVLVLPGGVDRSGRERVIPALLWLIERLARRHRVTVVVLGQEPRPATWPLLGATVVNVSPENPGPHRLARLIGRAVRAAGSQGRPDVVHAFWASVSGLVAVAAARRWRVPSVVSVAGGELAAFPDIGYGGGLGRGGRLIGRLAVTRAATVTVASDWMVDHLAQRGLRAHAVVPWGVDTTRFRPPDRPPTTNRLIQVANLNMVKDQGLLLRAVALARREVPDLTVEIVGVDTLGGTIQRLAADLGLDDTVRFAGFVPSDELPARFQAARLHVISSRHDAGPVAVLEAAACGVPTVGTEVGHVADLAKLDPPGARTARGAEGLAEAIVALLRDPAQRGRLADAARAWALRHDADATAACYEALYPAQPGLRR
jgi:glycosyltransferase involved in cell wall biosynthesis